MNQTKRYKRRTPSRKRVGRATHLIEDLTVNEVSLVDFPANNRPWSIMKQEKKVTKGDDGRRVVSADRSETTLAADIGQRMGLIAAAFEDTGGAVNVAKALDINDQASRKFKERLPQILERLDRACELLYYADSTHYQGSLDMALGNELAGVAKHLMDCAAAFGVEAMPEEEEIMMAETEKAHRMGKRRVDSMIEAVMKLNKLLSEFGVNLSEMEDEKEEQYKSCEKSEGPGPSASFDDETMTNLVSVITSLNDRLGAVEHTVTKSQVKPQKPASTGAGITPINTVVTYASTAPAASKATTVTKARDKDSLNFGYDSDLIGR